MFGMSDADEMRESNEFFEESPFQRELENVLNESKKYMCSVCKTQPVDFSGMTKEEIEKEIRDFPQMCDYCFEEDLQNVAWYQ